MNLYFNTELSVFFQDQTLKDEAWRVVNGKRVGLTVQSDPFPISYESTLKPKTLVDRVGFGDGYEQVSESGIRSQKIIFDVKWNNISDLRTKALIRFFTGEGSTSIYYRRPSEWFWWLPPEPFRSVGNGLPIRIICLEGWTVTPSTWNSSSVSATFEESFTP